MRHFVVLLGVLTTLVNCGAPGMAPPEPTSADPTPSLAVEAVMRPRPRAITIETIPDPPRAGEPLIIVVHGLFPGEPASIAVLPGGPPINVRATVDGLARASIVLSDTATTWTVTVAGGGATVGTRTITIASARSTDRSKTSNPAPHETSAPSLPIPDRAVPQDKKPVCVLSSTPGNCAVTTFAGYGSPNVGDGGPAVAAYLQRPMGILPIGSDLYIADTYGNRIRRVDSSGVISTVIGSGSGEGLRFGDGRALEVTLRFPQDVRAGIDGSLYVVDSNHYAIRRLGADGILRIVVGGVNSIYSGDGGPARLAGMSGPTSIAFDSGGDMYIAEQSGNRIRRVDHGGIINTFAGTGMPESTPDGASATGSGVAGPTNLVLDPDRRVLYFLEFTGQAYRVRSLSLPGAVLRTIVDVPPLRSPSLTIDGSGRLIYFSESAFRQWDPARGTSVTLATLPDTLHPEKIAVDAAGTIFFSDPRAGIVYGIFNGRAQAIAGGGSPPPGDGLPATMATVYDTQGVAADGYGNVFWSDFDHNQIRKIDRNGIMSTVAGDGRAESSGDGGPPLAASFSVPTALQFDPNGQLLFIDQTGGVGVVRAIAPGADGVIDGSADERIFTIAGQPAPRSAADHGTADGGAARRAVFTAARGLCVDTAANVYVSDTFDHTVRMIVPGADRVLNGGSDEIISTILSVPGIAPAALACRTPGTFYVHDFAGLAILRISNEGTQRVTGAARVVAMRLDADENLLFTETLDDLSSRMVRVMRSDGSRMTVLEGSFKGLSFFDISPDGSVFVADNGGFKIYRVGY